MDHFFLDHGFFSILLKDPNGQKINNWNQSLLKYKIVASQRSVSFLASPFLLLESIGITLKAVQIPKPKIPINLLSADKIEELNFFLYEYACSFYSNLPELQPDAIKDATAKQKTYLSDFGRGLFQEVIAHNVDKSGFHKHIYSTLALNYIQTFEYPDEVNDVALASLTVDILRGKSGGAPVGAMFTLRLNF